VLHDHDLAEAIVDRVLEKGRLIVVDGPSYRTRHLELDKAPELRKDAVRISGKRTS
jgi:DNA replication protein DnaC